MRPFLLSLGLLGCAGALAAQAPGHWPPDSLINTKVFPHSTPVMQVVGQMRNITGALGVRCPFCHVGEEGMPLERFDFAKDEKHTKLVARQMMLMVQEINRRLDTLPEHGHMGPSLQVSCATCHRGVSRPVPLATLIEQTDSAAGADSAIRANRFDYAFALLKLNEDLFPGSSGMYVFRGNIFLMKSDTAAAVAAFREAVK